MKHYGKLTAAAAAGFMTLSAMGVAPVFAADEDTPVVGSGNSYTITKNLDLTDDLKPNTNEKFAFTVVAGVPTVTAEGPGKEYAGEMNAVKNSTIEAAKSATDDKVYSGTLEFNPDNFSHPGIFVYTLTETLKKGNGFTDTTPAEAYTVRVEVANKGADSTNSKYDIAAITAQKGTDPKVSQISFAAAYNPGSFKVTKKLLGNQAFDGDGPFAFKLTISKGTSDGDITVTAGDETVNPTITDTAYEYTFNLAANGSVTVNGLDKDNTYTLTETDAKGYEKQDDITNTLSEAEDGSITDAQDADFTNTKKGTVPTGILMTAAPYAGLVALGGVFAGLFFRRKRED